MMSLNLHKGCSEPDVAVLQEKLGVKSDGIFGPATERALIAKVVSHNRERAPAVREDGIVDSEVWRALGLSAYSRRCEVPTAANNGSVRPARQSTMLKAFGVPRSGPMPVDCCGVDNPRLASRMVAKNVGPFRVTGLDAAVNSLVTIFLNLLREEPELYARLGNAGMLCVRAVRGSTTNWSNHSWGTAIDLTVDGMLDKLGDGFTQFGLQVAARHFNNHGWYWGAEFSREDAMHFEAGEKLIQAWSNGKGGFI